MVSKKKILEDMKKYNSALEKHVSSIDPSLLEEKALNSGVDSANKEYFTLLSGNLVDVRTELALLRKNLSNDVESMIMRSVENSHLKVEHTLAAFQSKITLEVKRATSHVFDDFSEEFHKIKEDIKEVKLSQNKMAMSFETLKGVFEDNSEFLTEEHKNHKLMLTKIQSSINDLPASFELDTIDSIDKKCDFLEKELHKRFLVLEKYIEDFATKLDINMKSSKELEKRIMISNKEVEERKIETPMEKKLLSEFSNLGELEEENPFRELTTLGNKERTQKFIDIDARLQKLSSMKEN